MRQAWKTATFLLGLGWLLLGATTYGYGDWDWRVSVLMAGSTYLCVCWVFESLTRPARWPVAAFLTWWCVQGSYQLYWSLVDPSAMVEQWQASLCLFVACGVTWSTLPRFLAGPGSLGPTSMGCESRPSRSCRLGSQE
jgi:hypothetical protein